MKTTLILLFAAGLTLTGMVSLDKAVETEYKIKVGLIYNFLKFTEWSGTEQDSEGSEELTLAIAADDDVYQIFNFLDGKTAQNRKIKLIRISLKDFSSKEPAFLKQADVIYLSHQTEDAVDPAAVLSLIKDHSILLVGEAEGFLEKGGMINFLKEENHITFEINLDEAKKAKLLIKTSVLKLAKRVIQKKD